VAGTCGVPVEGLWRSGGGLEALFTNVGCGTWLGWVVGTGFVAWGRGVGWRCCCARARGCVGPLRAAVGEGAEFQAKIKVKGENRERPAPPAGLRSGEGAGDLGWRVRADGGRLA
jgi:hypothetical protein